ncbi:hypothetical protein BJX62DRAFT_214224 [Aspergillus germanicus]
MISSRELNSGILIRVSRILHCLACLVRTLSLDPQIRCVENEMDFKSNQTRYLDSSHLQFQYSIHSGFVSLVEHIEKRFKLSLRGQRFRLY